MKVFSMAVSGSPKGGRDCILPFGGLYNPYHLLGEPETAIDILVLLWQFN